ncbi:GerMN domain-containing protein [Bacillus sp. SCS-153A]|uniref:GerMN domain-containing protein n=1 Tax=Rossellomorea sedimentorum TaxID=3115294 RepID=UPI003906CB3C
MKKNNWDETEIEGLLREMPSIKDNRSRDEIYQAVKRSNSVKKPKTWGYPALAGIAALLILALISPSLFNSVQQTEYENSAFDMAVQESADGGSAEEEMASLPERSEEKTDIEGSSFSDTENNNGSSMMQVVSSEKQNVYQADLLEYDLFTLKLVTPDATAVPVSILVEKKDTGDWLERFKAVSQAIPEGDWGFEEYYPLPGSLEVDEDSGQLRYIVTEDEQKHSGGGEEVLYQSLQFILQASPYERIMLQKTDGSVPSFAHMGKISDIQKNAFSSKGYYQYTHENGEIYLVPGETAFDSISEALAGMKSSPSDGYEPVIDKDIQLVSTDKNNVLTISFEEELTMKGTEGRMLLIEGILLTAKEFGFKKVMFLNLENTSWEGFDFSKPVPVPISPNKKVLN